MSPHRHTTAKRKSRPGNDRFTAQTAIPQSVTIDVQSLRRRKARRLPLTPSMQNLIWIAVALWSCLSLSSEPVETTLAPPTPSPTEKNAAECTLTVNLIGGRTLSAVLDPQTDVDQLWLRFGLPNAQILRPVDWDRVASANLAGHTFSGRQLHAMVAQIREENPRETDKDTFDGTIELIGDPQTNRSEVITVATSTSKPPRVVSLAIDAWAGQWDANADPDGIVVKVYPVAADGSVIPVRGTIQVGLKIGQRNRHSLHQPFVQIGQWSETVRQDDFGTDGAVVRLRFQAVNPELSGRGRCPGLVHACLTVPGQGTFEASTYLASIRPFNPIRDELQAARAQ